MLVWWALNAPMWYADDNWPKLDTCGFQTTYWALDSIYKLSVRRNWEKERRAFLFFISDQASSYRESIILFYGIH